MQPPVPRSTRNSKILRKMSMTEQLKTSNLSQSRHHQKQPVQQISAFHDLEQVFNPKTKTIHSTYCETIYQSNTKAMMHIGLCLPSDQIIFVIKQLFHECGLPFNPIKMEEKLRKSEGILFVPFWYYRIEGCILVFWILTAGYFLQNSEVQKKRQIDIFLSYPQIIVTNNSVMKHLGNQKSILAQKLNFEQQIMVVTNSPVNKGSKTAEIKNRVIHVIPELSSKLFNSFALRTMKKNSLRCFKQPQIINFYVIQSLNYEASSSILSQDLQYKQMEQNLIEIIDFAASRYLSEQIERKCESLIQLWKTSHPKNEKQIQNELSQYEEQINKEVKRNIKILNQPQKEIKLLEAAERMISISIQQILSHNRQLIKKQNNELLSDLYEKLLNNFDKGKYTNKDRINLMAQDLETMMSEYEKKAVKSNSLFWIFSLFMRNNKGRYYQKIQSLEEQPDHNPRASMFQDIYDKITMKKRVLLTLQKQVKSLQHKKIQVEAQNEHLKRLERELNQKINFQTQGDEFPQGDSMKTIKTRQLKSHSKVKNSPPKILACQIQSKDRQKDKKQRSCFECCKCQIF